MKTLRKFGLEHCDLPTMLWNVTVLLRVLTLNINKRYTKPIPIIFYVLLAVACICYYYVYLISMIWFVFVKCRETGDLIDATVVFSLGIASEIGNSKLIYMFFHKDMIQNIVEDYVLCDSAVVPGSRFENNLLKTLRLVKKRAIIFWMTIIGNGLVYIHKPLLLPGKHFMEDSFIIYGFEPMFESPNYEIVYCITYVSVILICYLTSNISAFLIMLTGYTEAQMLALSEEMAELWADAQKHYNETHGANEGNELVDKNKVINAYIKERLKEVVKGHATTVNLNSQVESVFRGAIAIEFVLLGVSLIVELLGGLKNTYLEIPFALIQVGMDCFMGQRIMDASGVLENAVYDSKWENFDTSNMKTVLLMLQHSQKTLTISAGGLTMLSFATLMSVMKTVYSAYTALCSTVNLK